MYSSLPCLQNRAALRVKWNERFENGSSLSSPSPLDPHAIHCYLFFFFFFNCLDLFIALHLPTFDVNLILKARTYMLSTYHIVSKYRAWNILFVEQIVTTEIHCVVTMAPGTGLLYSSLNMVVFILLIHPRRLKTGKVKWIPKNTQFGGSGGARFFWPQSLYSFRANRLDLVKSDMN